MGSLIGADTFIWDDANKRLGIGTTSPTALAFKSQPAD
jgi:hypothetical protein